MTQRKTRRSQKPLKTEMENIREEKKGSSEDKERPLENNFEKK